MSKRSVPAKNRSAGAPAQRRLTQAQFHALRDVPAVSEWLANIANEKTRRAYKTDLQDFVTFTGILDPDEFRLVTRAHFIAWRKTLEERKLSASTIRRKLSAMASLFDYLCEKNAVASNPVDGVKRPSEGVNEGKTPALSGTDAKRLLDAPSKRTLKGKRDRAILAVFLFHGLRSSELAGLCVRDIHSRKGVLHLRVKGKGSKLRYVVLHKVALGRILDYLECSGHRRNSEGPLFRPMVNSRGGLDKHLSGTGIYDHVMMHYALQLGIVEPGVCVHSLRKTASTNALENGADIAKVQEWLGHANISTTKLYDQRKTRAEESPTHNIDYSDS